MDASQVVSSVILRKKNCPDAPLITSPPLDADLSNYDVVDEHGNQLNDQALDNLRQQQAERVSGAEPHVPMERQRVAPLREPVAETPTPVVREEPKRETAASAPRASHAPPSTKSSTKPHRVA
jgi:hypothetical protein